MFSVLTKLRSFLFIVAFIQLCRADTLESLLARFANHSLEWKIRENAGRQMINVFAEFGVNTFQYEADLNIFAAKWREIVKSEFRKLYLLFRKDRCKELGPEVWSELSPTQSVMGTAEHLEKLVNLPFFSKKKAFIKATHLKANLHELTTEFLEKFPCKINLNDNQIQFLKDLEKGVNTKKANSIVNFLQKKIAQEAGMANQILALGVKLNDLLRALDCCTEQSPKLWCEFTPELEHELQIEQPICPLFFKLFSVVAFYLWALKQKYISFNPVEREIKVKQAVPCPEMDFFCVLLPEWLALIPSKVDAKGLPAYLKSKASQHCNIFGELFEQGYWQIQEWAIACRKIQTSLYLCPEQSFTYKNHEDFVKILEEVIGQNISYAFWLKPELSQSLTALIGLLNYASIQLVEIKSESCLMVLMSGLYSALISYNLSYTDKQKTALKDYGQYLALHLSICLAKRSEKLGLLKWLEGLKALPSSWCDLMKKGQIIISAHQLDSECCMINRLNNALSASGAINLANSLLMRNANDQAWLDFEFKLKNKAQVGYLSRVLQNMKFWNKKTKCTRKISNKVLTSQKNGIDIPPLCDLEESEELNLIAQTFAHMTLSEVDQATRLEPQNCQVKAVVKQLGVLRKYLTLKRKIYFQKILPAQKEREHLSGIEVVKKDFEKTKQFWIDLYTEVTNPKPRNFGELLTEDFISLYLNPSDQLEIKDGYAAGAIDHSSALFSVLRKYLLSSTKKIVHRIEKQKQPYQAMLECMNSLFYVMIPGMIEALDVCMKDIWSFVDISEDGKTMINHKGICSKFWQHYKRFEFMQQTERVINRQLCL